MSDSDSNSLGKMSKIEELERLEGQVGGALEGFAIAGLALRDIRDEGLFQEKYSSFKAYCQHRWALGPSRAEWLIKAGACMNRIFASQALDKPYPIHEGQVVPLLALPEEEQVPAWREAVANTHGGQPTGETIQMAVTTRLPVEDVAVDEESEAIRSQFVERLLLVTDGPPQTLTGLTKLFDCSRSEARAFIQMCEVSPAVQLSRYADAGPTEYEFEATHCVLGRDRIKQLASHILQDPEATANSIECAGRILHTMGENYE